MTRRSLAALAALVALGAFLTLRPRLAPTGESPYHPSSPDLIAATGRPQLLEFPDSAEVLADVLELIRLESACCRFLRFELETGPRGAKTTLTPTGPAGTAAFLAALGWGAAAR
jgi:hypothetical protein